MRLPFPHTARVLLLAVGVATLLPTRAAAYVNSGFRSQKEYWDYLKQNGRRHEIPGGGWDDDTPRSPPFVAPPRARAYIHMSKGEWKQAIKLYDKAAVEAGDDPAKLLPVCYERGDAWWQLREYARAIADYQKAVQQADLLTKKNVREPFHQRKAYIRMALIFAAYPDSKVRDRARSVA